MLLPARLFNRAQDSHKGDYGHVFILAGSERYVGAALLAGRAALRSGAGLVTLGIPKGLCRAVVGKVPELMTLPLPGTIKNALSEAAYGPVVSFAKETDVLLVGPGLSRSVQTQRLIRKLVTSLERPCVFDADALFALAGHLELLRKKKADFVLTPHPKEMARLEGMDLASIQKDRKKVAKDFSVRYNINLVLKGSHTVIAGPDGRLAVNETGNPGMATAGSGDVLAGILAAFVGQGISLFEAATAAARVHGLAGDLAAKSIGEISLVASDIIDYLPAAFKLEYSSK